MNRDERIAVLGDKLEAVEGRTERIWAKNDFVDFPVFKAPTDLLLLNPLNRRFRAEAQEIESELGRRLDPTASPDDETSVVALLLDKDPHIESGRVVGGDNKDTAALIADWDKRRQERPLWIRPDGLVCNGNRRLAMLKRLQGSRGVEGYDWVDVIVMDEGTYDDDTMFEMEAREQLTEGLKVRYTKMNLLLTLKDAAEKEDIDWHDRDSIEEVSRKIQDLVGNDPRYARVQLQAVKYMTEYLDWRGTPGEYSVLRGMVERFRDLGKNMAWVADEDASREAEMLSICFQAIAVGTSHPDMRELRRLLKSDPEGFDQVVGEIEGIEEATEGEDESPVVVEPPSPSEDDDEVEDEEGEDEEAPAPSGGLTQAQKQIQKAINVAVRASRDSREDKATMIRSAAVLLSRTDPEGLLDEIAAEDLAALREAIEGIANWGEAARAATTVDPGD